MLHAQRSSGRGDFWRMPRLTMPRAFFPALRRHGMTAATGVVGLTGIAVAGLVEGPYLRAGLMLHIGLLMASGGFLMVNAARSRHARTAEAVDIAHDLRGPLVSLQTTLELLAGDGFGALPEPARAAAIQAAITSGRVAEMVDRTLERTTFRALATPSTTGTTNLNAVLHEAVDVLGVQVRSTGATIEVAAMPRVAGDPSTLFRVFTNLLQNGLKYHQPDIPPRITVTAEMSKDWAEIAVADRGIGIAPADRARIFERHYRARSGAARAAGEGLGLATVHRLVVELGGAVWVDGAASQGTTIRVRLPLA